MLSVGRPVESAPFPPGNRHGVSNTPFHEGKFSWDPPKLQTDTIVRPGGYPSPPMSGSPPFESARTAHDPSPSGSSPHHSILSDASNTRWPVDHQGGIQGNRTRGMIPLSNTYPQETPRAPHMRRLSEQRLPPLMTCNTPESISSLHGTPRQPFISPSSSITPQHHVAPVHNQVPESSNRVTSPRSQRKTKGHVASACVPCKRAHLRCDAQRPCSRCVTHGKEDACVDVQHKKRGRPRLRDDRESRMDASRFIHGQDIGVRRVSNIRPASMGRQLFYDSPTSAGASAPTSGFTSPETPGLRYLPRVFSADAAFRGERQPQLPIEEPLVYMRTNMEIVKVSSSFSEAIGASGLIGRRMMDVVAPEASDTIIDIVNAISAEQKARDPHYLPPIFDKADDAVRALGVSAEGIGRIEFNHQAYVTFRSHDGRPRSYPLRFGLLKEGSFYFIAALISVQARAIYQPALSQSREAPAARVGLGDAHSTPAHASTSPIDHSHRRFSDGPSALRHQVGMAAQVMPQRTSPHSGYQSIYSASPHGGDYSRPSTLQIPRSELSTPLLVRPSESQYTLPPIRSLADRAPDSPERDEKQRRVTIGGMMNRPGM